MLKGGYYLMRHNYPAKISVTPAFLQSYPSHHGWWVQQR